MAKKKSNIPRVKRMKREARIQSARPWLEIYEGKSIVRGYKKRYGVDELTALIELQKLGVQISDDKIQQVRTSMESKAAERRRKKELEEESESLEPYSYSDENFAFIAGYTSGGFPYGITWEEWEDIEDNENE